VKFIRRIIRNQKEKTKPQSDDMQSWSLTYTSRM